MQIVKLLLHQGKLAGNLEIYMRLRTLLKILEIENLQQVPKEKLNTLTRLWALGNNAP